jgi:ligand-binding SRPBCC domain-containing protein
MPVYKIVEELKLNATLDEVWAFFSHANNLQRITPKHMNFRVTSGDLPDEIYPGMIITYKVSPLLGIPLFWMTEITHVVPGKHFVDEQRRGPYKMWHHEHHFREASDGSVIMKDIVHYQLPMGFLGSIAHWLFVRKQLTDIFEYRKGQVKELFS